jgi:hypothetical protein
MKEDHRYTLGIVVNPTKDPRNKHDSGHHGSIGFAGITGFSYREEIRSIDEKADRIRRHLKSFPYSAVEIGEPKTAEEAGCLGFNSKELWRSHVDKILEKLPLEMRDKIRFVPRGSTQATAEAAGANLL